MKIKTFLSDGLSIDESKVSLFMICLVISFGYCIYLVQTRNDVPTNFLNLTLALITAIGGLNVVDKVKDLVLNNKTSDTTIDDEDEIEQI